MISIDVDGVTVEEDSLSSSCDNEQQATNVEDSKQEPMQEVLIAQSNSKAITFNHDFRSKLKEPSQNCFMRGSTRCCFTLWICANLWCALQVAFTTWIIVRSELCVHTIGDKSDAIRWGIIGTAFGSMALYGLHRCVPEFILLYVGAFATAIAANTLDTVIDSLTTHHFEIVRVATMLLLIAFGLWGSIVFYRVYQWANYFRYVKGGYDPQMRFPLFL